MKFKPRAWITLAFDTPLKNDALCSRVYLFVYHTLKESGPNIESQ